MIPFPASPRAFTPLRPSMSLASGSAATVLTSPASAILERATEARIAAARRWLDSGQPASTLVHSPAFVDAMLRAHQHKALRYYGHEAKLDPVTGDALLLVEGKHVPFREVAKRF